MSGKAKTTLFTAMTLAFMALVIYTFFPITKEKQAEIPLYTFEEIVEMSDVIVYGTITNIKNSRWTNPDSVHGEDIVNEIATDFELTVGEQYKGEKIDEIIIVRSYIGRKGFHKWISEDYPDFDEGEEVIVFLRKPDPRYEVANEEYYLPVGLVQGKFKA